MDTSQAMSRYANERTNHRIKSYVTNLGEPLHFVEEEKVDLIVSSLTLHYIENRQ